jgi:hypothetical protein
MLRVRVGDRGQVRDHLQHGLLVAGARHGIANAQNAEQAVLSVVVMDERTDEVEPQRRMIVLDRSPFRSRHVQPIFGEHLDLGTGDPPDLPVSDLDLRGGGRDVRDTRALDQLEELSRLTVRSGRLREVEELLLGLENRIDDANTNLGICRSSIRSVESQAGPASSAWFERPVVRPELRLVATGREAGSQARDLRLHTVEIGDQS